MLVCLPAGLPLQVTSAGLALLTDDSLVGTCLVVLADGNWVEPQRTRFKTGRCSHAAGRWRYAVLQPLECKQEALGWQRPGVLWLMHPRHRRLSWPQISYNTCCSRRLACSGDACQRLCSRGGPSPPLLGHLRPLHQQQQQR